MPRAVCVCVCDARRVLWCAIASADATTSAADASLKQLRMFSDKALAALDTLSKAPKRASADDDAQGLHDDIAPGRGPTGAAAREQNKPAEKGAKKRRV